MGRRSVRHDTLDNFAPAAFRQPMPGFQLFGLQVVLSPCTSKVDPVISAA